MEEIVGNRNSGDWSYDFLETGDYYEYGLVGNFVSEILLFTDSDRFGWRAGADTNQISMVAWALIRCYNEE